MNKSEVIRAWARILAGRAPSLSIEITKECPLRCPGCYAFDEAHLGGTTRLRELSDYRGDDLVTRVLALIDEMRPLHVSLVGGDPMVRYRELDALLPQIEKRGVHTQVVTSAFRVIPEAWMQFKKLNIVVSIDGLQPEHDARRKPATYERILKNIEGVRVTVHCTITSQIAERPGYLDEFLGFWTSRPEVAKVWFSIFTPQQGAADQEILTPSQRTATISELRQLRLKYPKLDMPEAVIRELATPPRNPRECIFARTTGIISADLVTKITPCQFGGNPDCAQCGCVASMGLAAVGHHRVVGPLTAGRIFMASDRLGKLWMNFQRKFSPKPFVSGIPSPFNILAPDVSRAKRTPWGETHSSPVMMTGDAAVLAGSVHRRAGVSSQSTIADKQTGPSAL
jgi:MoaA/NifB/PqqE/SkfB family radical SAM enzyme